MQIFQISSTMGSIGNLAANLKGSGRYPFASKAQLAYRASKAALNMGKLCMCTVTWQESLFRRHCWSLAAQQTYGAYGCKSSVRRKHQSALLYEISTPLCIKSTDLRGALLLCRDTLAGGRSPGRWDHSGVHVPWACHNGHGRRERGD